MIDHFIELKPTAGEVPGECGKLGVGDHAEGLLTKDLRVSEFPLISELEEFAVRHGGPKEVGKTGGDFEVVERPFVLAGFIVFGTEEESWIDEKGGERCPERLLEIFIFLLAFGEGIEKRRKVFFAQSAAIS